MKLFEHPDFEQAVIRAAEHFQGTGWRPAFIEKDYFATEALRLIADAAGDKVIFKGGTSLSKGWNLIERFSEDLDLFLDPIAFDPPLGKNAINRELKKLSDKVAAHPAFSFLPAESCTIGGFGRCDRFEYVQRFVELGGVVNRILCEVGTASGREPTEVVSLQSCVGRFLQETRSSMGAEDEGAFTLRLLHFRRTFVEKMFAIHSKVQLWLRDGQPVGAYARHYYDLFQLAGRPEVEEMLRSAEYTAIKADYDQISKVHFFKSYFQPENMSFSGSPALFPSPELAAELCGHYERECNSLCYGPFPTWADVQARFLHLQPLL